MSREWRPGDVAVICVPKSSAPKFGVTERGHTELRAVRNDSGGWSALENPDYFWAEGYAFHAKEPRPLLVIDPEDRERVTDLTETFYRVRGLGEPELSPYRVGNMQSALRSLVDPPKPAEPTGIGAVVEDVDGRRWVHAPSGIRFHAWSGIDSTRHYEDIAAVRILSEGVQP